MDYREVLFGIFVFLAFAVPMIVISTRSSKKYSDKIRQEEYGKTKSLLERGVTAPAGILSAKYSGGSRKLHGGTREVGIEYEVEVYPDDRPSFRSKFQTWIPYYDIKAPPKGQTSFRSELQSWLPKKFSNLEQAKTMWVIFDPNDPAQMEVHHYDFQHEDYLIKKDWMQRRNRFIDGENEATRVREMGVEALATILEVEDLNVANEEEQKQARSMRLKFRVTPNSGPYFESQTYVMLALESMPKMVVGRQFYVKYDPQKPEISALIRDANS